MAGEGAAPGRRGPRRRAHRRLGRGLAGLHAGRGREADRRRRREDRSASPPRWPRCGPAVAMIGGPALAHTNGLFAALAVNALNALLGSVDQPGGVSFTPQWNVAAAAKATGPAPAAPALAGAAGGGVLAGDAAAPQVLMLDGANPVFAAPKAWRVREALEKVPYIVSFGSFLDETSGAGRPDPAGPLVPRVVGRERAGVRLARGGGERRAAGDGAAAPDAGDGDVLLDVAAACRRRSTCRGSRWRRCSAPPSRRCRRPPKAAMRGPRRRRRAAGGARCPRRSWPRRRRARRGRPAPAAFAEPQFDGDAAKFPFHFLPYASTTFYDGSAAHLPWLQEMPDPLTSAMWSSWVEINPQTAAKLGIGEGDLVDVTSAHGTLRSSAVHHARHRARHRRHADGAGPHAVHALRHRARREPGGAAGAADRAGDGRGGVGGDARDGGAGRRSRRPPGALCRRQARRRPRAREEHR